MSPSSTDSVAEGSITSVSPPIRMSRSAIRSPAARNQLRVPLEQKVRHEYVAFSANSIDGRGEVLKVEVAPGVEHVVAKLALGKAQQVGGQPLRHIALPLPDALLRQGLRRQATMLVLLAAAAGARIVSPRFFSRMGSHKREDRLRLVESQDPFGWATEDRSEVC